MTQLDTDARIYVIGNPRKCLGCQTYLKKGELTLETKFTSNFHGAQANRSVCRKCCQAIMKRTTLLQSLELLGSDAGDAEVLAAWRLLGGRKEDG